MGIEKRRSSTLSVLFYIKRQKLLKNGEAPVCMPNITSMSISSSLCLKFPLLVLRYSGTEDTNFLK